MAIKHYTGKLYGSRKVSDFDYDDEIFEIHSFWLKSNKDKDALVYKFPKGSKSMDLVVSLPKGVYSTAFMFSNRPYRGTCKSLSLVDFNTYDVDCMDFMFDMLTTRVLNLGNKFFTGNVHSMSWMFSGVVTEKPIDLGKYFDTSSVEDMSYMFSGAVLRKGFSLGNRFHTGNVTDMQGMFYGVISHRDFTLGTNFDTRNVITMEEMFDQYDEAERRNPYDIMCVIDEEEQEGISASIKEENLDWYTPLLGDKFDTSNVKCMDKMFNYCCKFPENFTLGAKFDTSNVVMMTGMFCNAKLPRNFIFGSRFKIPPMVSDPEDCEDAYLGMLSGYKIYPDSDLSLFINSGCDLGVLFCDVEFSDDYVFPDWFDFSSYPKERENGKIGCEEVCLNYKNKYCYTPSKILEMLLCKDAKVAHDCKREEQKRKINLEKQCKKELLKLLKEGKTISEARQSLVSSKDGSGYSQHDFEEILDSAIIFISEALTRNCNTDISNLLSFKSNDKYSKYTIGEVRGKLLAKGYPKEIVYECILNYIGDQYLTL